MLCAWRREIHIGPLRNESDGDGMADSASPSGQGALERATFSIARVHVRRWHGSQVHLGTKRGPVGSLCGNSPILDAMVPGGCEGLSQGLWSWLCIRITRKRV